MSEQSQRRSRDQQVQWTLLVEGSANAAALVLKLVAGLSTGSLAILGDAIHSFTDLTNNAIAWFVVRISAKPADREHPYGHRKFETLAVFFLATLLAVLALELALGALRREPEPITDDAWALGLMLGVLGLNVAIASWESAQARRLDSDILRADARHTFADVLTTVVVIGGWQLAARGAVWLDTACALGVAGLIAYFSYDLFRRAIPVLVDGVAVDSDEVTKIAGAIPGVEGVLSVRSRWTGPTAAIDMVIAVNPGLPTAAAHEIADEIERRLRRTLRVGDVTVHVEPEPATPSSGSTRGVG